MAFINYLAAAKEDIMDNQLIWKDEFNIGITLIDEEHQRLFTIISRLFALEAEEKKNKKACMQ